MTLEEKVGQMLQIDVGYFLTPHMTNQGNVSKVNMNNLLDVISRYHTGSLLNNQLTVPEWHEFLTLIHNITMTSTRLQIPVLYGIDSLHGAQFVFGSAIFPHNMGAGATFNLDLIKQSASITAKDTRAAGIPWAFTPNLEAIRQPVWSRNYEIFSEDPYASAQMTRAYIQGASGEATESRAIPADKVISCAKHFIGYNNPLSGKDHTDTVVSDRELHERYLGPFDASFDEGVQTVMASMGSLNGVPATASKRVLTGLLRDEMQFQGMLVSDYEAIQKLHTRYHVAPTMRDAVKMAIDAGLDMAMYATDTGFFDLLVDLVRKGEVSEERITKSVERILNLKEEVGLFDNAFPPAADSALVRSVGSAQDRAAALEMARESMTLLKNEANTLPLSPSALRSVLVTGPAADSLSVLNGGWTIHWQGATSESEFWFGSTLVQGVRDVLAKHSSTTQVKYVKGSDFLQQADLAAAVEAASTSDAIIVAVGESPYAEVNGNIDDLALPEPQLELIQAMNATGKPVIVVLVAGRTRTIPWVADNVPAILMAYLPGVEGGQAIAETIFGDANPSGKLPATYPRHQNDLAPYYRYYSDITKPQWNFGYGLSYSKFEYANLAATLSADQSTVTVTVDVTNRGPRDGKEVVLAFVTQEYGPAVIPLSKSLKRFSKIALANGETKNVSFQINTTKDLSVVTESLARVVAPGKYTVSVGPLTADFVISPKA